MENFWSLLTKGAQNLGSHWASYSVLGSFVMYVLGYLSLRFHLTALGVGTDLSVIDERYLFIGTKFLLYLITSVPSLLLIILFFCLLIYLPSRILPHTLRMKVSGFFHKQWQGIQCWWLLSNRLVLLGIVLSLLIIQLVMRQCFLLSNLLLAEDLPSDPVWLRNLLLSQNDVVMVLYFSALLVGIVMTAAIFYISRVRASEINSNRGLNSLLGFLISVQLLLIPVNYGVLVHDKWMPRVTGVGQLGTLQPNEQAWLVWEGSEGKTFLLRKQQAGKYIKSLITLPKKKIIGIEILRHEQIFKFLFNNTPIKEQG